MLTQAKPTGIQTTRKFNLGQGKRSIWIGEERSAFCSGGRRRYEGTLATTQMAAKELHRATVIGKLRKRLVKMCGNTPPPLLAIERWLLNSLECRRTEPSNDPLFGGLCFKGQNFSKSSIVRDLIRSSVSEKRALHIARDLHGYARELMRGGFSPRKDEIQGSVLYVKHRHSLDVRFGKKSGKVLKLNHEHDAKLRSLWKIAHGKSVDEAQYRIDLYCLLSRYFCIQGHGFQAACPEQFFCGTCLLRSFSLSSRFVLVTDFTRLHLHTHIFIIYLFPSFFPCRAQSFIAA